MSWLSMIGLWLGGFFSGCAVAVSWCRWWFTRATRWCAQCQQHGHRKWLWLGTHKTHRLYLRFKMWQAMNRTKDQE